VCGFQVRGDVAVPVGDRDRVRQEAELAAGVLGQPVGDPRGVSDDLDLGRVDPGQLLDAVGHLGEYPRGERAPAGREEQLDTGAPPTSAGSSPAGS
jgi:hypothetical protein